MDNKQPYFPLQEKRLGTFLTKLAAVADKEKQVSMVYPTHTANIKSFAGTKAESNTHYLKNAASTEQASRRSVYKARTRHYRVAKNDDGRHQRGNIDFKTNIFEKENGHSSKDVVALNEYYRTSPLHTNKKRAPIGSTEEDKSSLEGEVENQQRKRSCRFKQCDPSGMEH